MKLFPTLAVLVLLATTCFADDLTFEDRFAGKLGPGWSWIRENPASWRVTENGLEVRVEPGNMWGKGNDAKNILVRTAPDPARARIEVSAKVENRPTSQYEQVDLVWYYGDSHMVKIGQELVDGELSIVMGREENDRTRTIAIVPLNSPVVSVQFQVHGSEIKGSFRTPDMADWEEVGVCELPVKEHVPPKISLQFYKGPADVEHWARVHEFRLVSSRPLPADGLPALAGTHDSENAHTNRPLVVCLGDSITRRGYPELLQKFLDVRVINAGVNGNTSRQGLARLQRDVLSKKPDVVVVFFGANDSRLDAPKTQVDLVEYASNLSKIVAACQQADAKVLLGTMPPIIAEPYFQRHPRENYDAVGGFEKHIERYCQAVLNLGRENNVPVVDLNRLLKKESAWVTPDGVHPTEQGNEILAKRIAAELKPLLGTSLARRCAREVGSDWPLPDHRRSTTMLRHKRTRAGAPCRRPAAATSECQVSPPGSCTSSVAHLLRLAFSTVALRVCQNSRSQQRVWQFVFDCPVSKGMLHANDFEPCHWVESAGLGCVVLHDALVCCAGGEEAGFN